MSNKRTEERGDAKGNFENTVFIKADGTLIHCGPLVEPEFMLEVVKHATEDEVIPDAEEDEVIVGVADGSRYKPPK